MRDDEQLDEQAVIGLDAGAIDELVEEMLTDHVAGNRCWGFELSLRLDLRRALALKDASS